MAAEIFSFPETGTARHVPVTHKASINRQLRRMAASLSLRWINLLEIRRAWAARWRQRRALEDLDNHLLRDIGVTRGEADQEARLPFWRP